MYTRIEVACRQGALLHAYSNVVAPSVKIRKGYVEADSEVERAECSLQEPGRSVGGTYFLAFGHLLHFLHGRGA